MTTFPTFEAAEKALTPFFQNGEITAWNAMPVFGKFRVRVQRKGRWMDFQA